MKKLFPFDDSQPFIDQFNHNTAYGNEDHKASPFEGTRRMYNSNGNKGKEQVSLSLLDGCDILKYTSSSESDNNSEHISRQHSQKLNKIHIRVNSMDRLSSTMKCSLGKINLSHHLNDLADQAL